jgi:hypothetical protein
MKKFLAGFIVGVLTALTGTVLAETQPAAPPTATPATATPAQSAARTDHESAAGVTLQVTELKRTSGDTLTLKFAMSNTGTTTDTYLTGTKLSEIYLIDAANKKKYMTLKDSEGKCVCTNGTDYVKPGMRVSAYAKFPAPPPEVKAISVNIPDFIPIDDVPISQ